MPSPAAALYDAIIVGGGPAGLSAAIVLGRCRRRVLLVDAGRARNRWSEGIRNYLGHDGIDPRELQRLGRAEAERYGVEVLACEATDAGFEGPANKPDRFWVLLDDGARPRARKLLLATGVTDVLPDIPGLAELYGRSVHHCPYCDGYEHRDERLAAYGPKGNGAGAVGLALSLRTWTAHVVALTDGHPLSDDDRARATRAGIRIREEPVARLEATGGRLIAVTFTHGPSEPCDALFFNTGQTVRSHLAQRLGCHLNPDGSVTTANNQCTDIPGLYMAGDADKDVQFAIVAAAEGATAAVSINRELQDDP